MAKLIITDLDGRQTQTGLDKERITIGRHLDNDVVLADRAVSGHHAMIITVLEDSFVEDLNSTNGTEVNGHPISRHPLSQGDEILIGRNRLRYERGPDASPVAAPRANPTHAPESAAAVPALGRLRIVGGAADGRELELIKSVTTIGKPGVQAAAITRTQQGYSIALVGESDPQRPARVSDRVLGDQLMALADGDMIELAGIRMRFSLHPPAQPV